jgi:D-alanyl-lipoteichoic acid acyltransferase DltB (MBOAT superfamily)
MSTDTATVTPVSTSVLARSGVWNDVGPMALIALQLGVILALVWAFNLESPAFARVVLPLAFGGFLIHHWLPRRYQPLFFAALSLTGIAVIFGGVAGGWLVGTGLVLIALCHLPIPFRARVAVIVVAAGALVAMRSAWLPTPWPSVIWPILGSMFMFRLAVYLYDLKHHGPASPGLVLSYFFMLPNTVFLLFPIIDFQTFRRTHYDKPALGIYDEGVRWIFRGLTHLVLYRVIYQYVALSPDEVGTTAGIVQYVVGNYGLYLRVSGQFHVIVGLLHLFGFRLPETHRFFYLASSFSDMWRRINIYWKDFMQKMVYLPMIFRLKHLSETPRLVLATLVVVAVTWFLHSYQWFWLLGTWLFSATDLMFWGLLGTFLLINILREQRRGRVRQLTAQMPTPRHAWREAIQTAGMFTLMCCLWGFWTSPTFEDFRVVLRAATFRPIDVVAVVGTFLTVALIAYLARRFSLGAPSALAGRPRWQHPLVVCALPLALFWVLGQPALQGRVPASVQAMSQQARLVELNKAEAERLQRGYYEKLVGVNRFNGQLWEVYARAEKPQGTDLAEGTTDAAKYRDEFGNRGYPPFLKRGEGSKLFTTNRWGFRDKDYEKTPPLGTRRIAVLGPSYVVGAGVKDGEPFEAVIEDRLNREWSAKSGLRYELLNFGLGSSSLAEQAKILGSGRIAEFKPDIVLLVGHINGHRQIGEFLWDEVKAGRPLAPSFGELVRKAGIKPEMSLTESQRRLGPFAKEMVPLALENAAAAIRRMDAAAVFALIPIPLDPFDAPQKTSALAAAAAAGFSVIDMQDVYDGQDAEQLIVDASNHHPNAQGHQVTAQRLYGELMRLPDVLVAKGNAAAAQAQAAWVASWTAQTAERQAALAATKTKEQRVAEQTAKRGELSKGRKQRFRSPWVMALHKGAKAKLEKNTTDPSRWRVTISALPEPRGYHVKVAEAPLPITKGRDYRVSFRAKADAPRPVAVGVERNVEPWGGLGFYKEFDVTPTWETFEWTFTAETTEPQARLFFDLGMHQTSAEVMSVVVTDVASGKTVPIVAPKRERGRVGGPPELPRSR